MVGLSDIPCVAKIVDRISDAMVDPLFRAFNYMFCYKDHVNVLNSEIEKVKIEEVRVSRKAVAATSDGKLIYDHVFKWQKDVEQIQESAKEFEERYKNRSSWRCIRCLPIPKPVSRFRLGREAVHKAKKVTELSNSAKDLLANDVACLPPVENLPTSANVFQDFESRKDVYEKLWETLVSDDAPAILGIYGMPGVGKTRMMEQIWQEAKDKKIFDKVARADVGSEELDVIKLQNQIAGHLDCHFESQDNKLQRANQLKYSLMNGGKILIILDDVWKYVPVDDIIGTSFADGRTSNGSKILLTSREKYVCLDNNCKHPVEITTLTTVEAWDLFKYTVGRERIDSLQDESLVKEVCNKCAGLPLLISAVGKALKCRPHDSWKDALYQLEKGKVEKIAGIDPQVYACVKLSIDRLPDDAKSCLFLCSLYPEDAVIRISELILLATGTQLVPDGESRVWTVVDILRSSSLLLDCWEAHTNKLHDLIRDVARSIAVRDPNYAFSIVRCGSRLPDHADYCTRKLLYLHLEKDNICFPDDLVCPNLHNLWLQCNLHKQQISGGFLGIFGSLRFLWIQGTDHVYHLELKFSLQPLGKLTTLILKKCNISQTSSSFFPENLETLCMWNCKLPVPLGLPNLKDLRKLEIQGWGCSNLQMVENTISSIPNLEELHIPDGFKIRDDGSEICSASILGEISNLTGLKSLKMFFIRESECFQDTNIFGNLLKFDISVGDRLSMNRLQFSNASVKRSIELKGGNHLELKGMNGLIERAEIVKLDSTHVNVSNIYNTNRKAFADLRFLSIQKCNTVEYLARGESQHGRSFSKLRTLIIEDCSAMKYLFSSSVVKCLVHLKHLTIKNCPEIEAIIMNEGTSDRDGNDILNMVNDGIQSGSTTHSSSAISQPLCDTTVQFPNLVDLIIIGCGKIKLEEMELGKDYSNCQLRALGMSCYNKIQFSCEWQLRLYNLGCLELTHYYWWRELKFQCFKRLQYLKIIEPGCSILFSFSSFENLHQLKSLEISSCEVLEQIVEDVRREEPSTATFFQLTSITLKDLPNLKSCFHGANYECHMPALVAVYVQNCGIPSLYTCSVIRTMQQLKGFRVKNCRLLEDIVEDARCDETSETNDTIITLPRLQLVELEDLPKLKSFSTTSSYAFNFPSLSSFKLLRCPQIEKFTSLKTSTRTVVHSDWHQYSYQQDLNDYIRKMRKREDKRLSDSAGESSHSNQETETEAEKVGEEKPQETEENDRHYQINPEPIGGTQKTKVLDL